MAFFHISGFVIGWPGPSRAKCSGTRGNILAGPIQRENFWIFLFRKVHSGVCYIFKRRWGPSNVAGPGVDFPSPTLHSRRACGWLKMPGMNLTDMKLKDKILFENRLHKRTDRYASCLLDLCHSVGLRPLFSDLWDSIRPMAPISACGLNFRLFGP